MLEELIEWAERKTMQIPMFILTSHTPFSFYASFAISIEALQGDIKPKLMGVPPGLAIETYS